MRVLFLHQRFGSFGGAEANILITADELRRRGHAIAIAYQAGTGRDESRWKETFESCWQLSPEVAANDLREVVEDFGPDLIYLNSIDNLDILRVLASGPTPVIRMVHDHDLYCLRSCKYNYFTRKICTRSLSWRCVFPCMGCVTRRKAGSTWPRFKSFTAKREELALNRQFAALFVYSDYCKRELTQNGFEPHLIHVHVPMLTETASRPSAGFGPENLVLFAGQIIRGKGVDALLQSLARVREPFSCVIAGQGNHRPYCERLCQKLGLSGKVTFAGYCSKESLAGLYQKASVFAMSSLWPEPFGMAGPEAMLFGLPVVAFDAGGIREWLRDGVNGYLVPWGDTQAYAERITQLLADKNRARMFGVAGREFVGRTFAAPAQVEKLERVFTTVIRRPKRATVCELEATLI